MLGDAGDATAGAEAVRVADQQRHARRHLVEHAQRAGRLALEAVLGEEVAVVGEIDDQRVPVQAERLDLVQQPADPAIDQRHLGGVERPHMIALSLAHVVVAAVAWHDQAVADIGRVAVARLVVGRRVERLVRVPHVDPEREAVDAMQFSSSQSIAVSIVRPHIQSRSSRRSAVLRR